MMMEGRTVTGPDPVRPTADVIDTKFVTVSKHSTKLIQPITG